MDIFNANNWHVLNEGTFSVQYLDQNSWYKIKPILIVASSPVISVKIDTSKRKSTWHTGAWLQPLIDMPHGRVKLTSKPLRCELGKWELFNVPYYGRLPYFLEITFPYWLESVNSTVLQFIDQSGQYLSSTQQAILSAVEVVEQRENELSQQLEQIRQKLGT
jgi:hypothetical protein